MSISIWMALALCAPPTAPQGDANWIVPKAAPCAAPVSSSALAGFDALVALGQPLAGPFAGSPDGGVAALYPAMRELADVGNGPALAWCARHLEVAGDDAAGALFTELVREHARAPWLAEAALDPLAALVRANGVARASVEAALAQAELPDEESLQLALLLRAVALAPRQAGGGADAQRALALLAESRERWPAGRFAARAAALAWRIEHLAPGAQAPHLRVFDVDGNEVVLSDWVGRDVLVDVWRADDPDLRAHLSALRRLKARVDELRPDRRLQVIGVGLGSQAGVFRRELEELELGWLTSFERDFEGRAGSAWRLDGVATTLWVDATGGLRATGLTLPELEQQLLAPDPEREPQASRPQAPLREPENQDTETTERR